MDSMPFPITFVNCRDRVEPLRELVAWLERAGADRIVLIDNGSAYEPLLAYYAQTPHEVVRLGVNGGRLSLFSRPELLDRAAGEPFVYTDPDVIPVEECPLDATDRFADLLERHPDAVKAGFGLVIDDLPRHYGPRRRVRRWEHRYWLDEIEPGVFRAPIDTTFALYRGGTRDFAFEPALRTGPPYVARHLGWYIDTAHPSEEERFYQQHVEGDDTHWSRGAELPEDLRHHTRARVGLRMLLNRARSR
jgi:hypothetical protein